MGNRLIDGSVHGAILNDLDVEVAALLQGELQVLIHRGDVQFLAGSFGGCIVCSLSRVHIRAFDQVRAKDPHRIRCVDGQKLCCRIAQSAGELNGSSRALVQDTTVGIAVTVAQQDIADGQVVVVLDLTAGGAIDIAAGQGHRSPSSTIIMDHVGNAVAACALNGHVRCCDHTTLIADGIPCRTADGDTGQIDRGLVHLIFHAVRLDHNAMTAGSTVNGNGIQVQSANFNLNIMCTGRI